MITHTDGSGDGDGDTITDAEEFALGTMPTIDSDNDGLADISDAFPNNAKYKEDVDSDGIADAWEKEFCGYSLYSCSADGDRDSDSSTDLHEFQNGTDPEAKDLMAADDLFRLGKGQTVTFDPTENDETLHGEITITSIDQPESGTLHDNQNGTYSFTADNNSGGWIRLGYTVADSQTTATGGIFMHIMSEEPPTLVKIGSSHYYGSAYSMALFDDGTLYAWGDNSRYQLGMKNEIKGAPTKIQNLPPIQDFSQGDDFVVALAKDKTLWVWGQGVGYVTPQKVAILTEVKAIAASYQYIYILNADGTVSSSWPRSIVAGSSKKINGFVDIEQISAGGNHLLGSVDLTLLVQLLAKFSSFGVKNRRSVHTNNVGVAEIEGNLVSNPSGCGSGKVAEINSSLSLFRCRISLK